MGKPGPRIGKCIYCGETRYSPVQQKLTREHAIAKGFGGVWTVLEAVCKRCQKIVNEQAENICINSLLGPLRYRLGLANSQAPATCPVQLSYDGITFQEIQVPLDKVPITLLMPCMKLPGILKHWDQENSPLVEISRTGPIIPPHPHVLKLSHSDPNAEDVYIAAEIDKMIALMKETGARDVKTVEIELLVDPLLRTIAKTAHAFAIWRLGGLVFKPFLQNLILGKKSAKPITYYAGGDPIALDNHAMDDGARTRHWMELNLWKPMHPADDRFVVVNMVLFRELKFPPFKVVVGRYRKGQVISP